MIKTDSWLENYFIKNTMSLVTWTRHAELHRQVAVGIACSVATMAFEAVTLLALERVGILSTTKFLAKMIADIPKLSPLSVQQNLFLTAARSTGIFVVAIGVPLFEEIIFRNLVPYALQTKLKTSKVANIALSSTVFALWHVERGRFWLASTFCMGIGWGITNNAYGLFPGFVAHSLRNTVSVLHGESLFRSNRLIAVTTVAAPLLLSAFAIKYIKEAWIRKASQPNLPVICQEIRSLLEEVLRDTHQLETHLSTIKKKGDELLEQFGLDVKRVTSARTAAWQLLSNAHPLLAPMLVLLNDITNAEVSFRKGDIALCEKKISHAILYTEILSQGLQILNNH